MTLFAIIFDVELGSLNACIGALSCLERLIVPTNLPILSSNLICICFPNFSCNLLQSRPTNLHPRGSMFLKTNQFVLNTIYDSFCYNFQRTGRKLIHLHWDSAERKSPKKYFSYFVSLSGLGLEHWLFV